MVRMIIKRAIQSIPMMIAISIVSFLPFRIYIGFVSFFKRFVFVL